LRALRYGGRTIERFQEFRADKGTATAVQFSQAANH
jgi:hypothetical protein